MKMNTAEPSNDNPSLHVTVSPDFDLGELLELYKETHEMSPLGHQLAKIQRGNYIPYVHRVTAPDGREAILISTGKVQTLYEKCEVAVKHKGPPTHLCSVLAFWLGVDSISWSAS